jgi:hypothetical protein
MTIYLSPCTNLSVTLHYLDPRGGGFSVGADGFDAGEPGALEHGGQFAFGKPEPAVGIGDSCGFDPIESPRLTSIRNG